MPSQETAGLSARRAALRMLDAVLRRDETLEHAATFSTKGLPSSDAGLAIAIAGEVLRRIPDLDALIDGKMQQVLPDDAKARMVLRMALAQKIALDTPDHAVVATALPLVEGGPRRLVHGVLSALLKGDLPDASMPHLPSAVEARWREQWGDDVILAARAGLAQRPPLDLSFKVVPDDFPGESLAPNHRRLTESGPVDKLPGFADGNWWVQDLAASLPARLIPEDAQLVLDACAAPGGKTMQLAAAGHKVVALDRSASRLKRLSENLARTGLAVQTVATALEDHYPATPYDAVLLDAPCSASGTFRRHPEILYRARPAVIEQMAEVQTRLLEASATLVKPGGSLVYASCSLERAEGEDQVTAFLSRHPEFSIRPAGLDGIDLPIAPEGWIRTLPTHLVDKGGLDGFFTAHLVRGHQ